MAKKVEVKKAAATVTPINPEAQSLIPLVIYNLYAPTWTAYKRDKKITAEVKAMNNVADEVKAGSFNKMLLPDCKTLDALKSYMGAVRQWVYERTESWGDARGDRVGLAEHVMVNMHEFGDKQEGLKPLKAAFAVEYEAEKARAELELNEMFDPDDYPPIEEVLERFQLRLSTRPLPNVRDIRVMTEIPAHIRDDIEKQMKQDFDTAYTATAKAAFERLLKPVAHMAATLRAYDKGEVKKLYDSVVENVRDIANMMHMLNITKNADIDKLADAAFELVQDIKAADLKESEGTLRSKAAQAEALAARIAKFMP
jgi:hypothetical protein